MPSKRVMKLSNFTQTSNAGYTPHKSGFPTENRKQDLGSPSLFRFTDRNVKLESNRRILLSVIDLRRTFQHLDKSIQFSGSDLRYFVRSRKISGYNRIPESELEFYYYQSDLRRQGVSVSKFPACRGGFFESPRISSINE